MSAGAPTDRSFDLARVTFQLLALAALIASSFWILRPFLIPMTWAVMIVVATWPLLKLAQAGLGGRRGLAAAAMTIVLLLVFATPIYFGVKTLVASARHVNEWSQWLATLTIPPPPNWLETVPAIGPRLAEYWQRLGATTQTELSEFLLPYARGAVLVLFTQVGNLGRLIIDVFLTLVIAAVLYAAGDTAAQGVVRFARRLAGPQGEQSVHLAGQAVRAVALGVVVTAFVQSTLAGIGLAIVGVPFAGALTVVMFIFSIAQVGPMPILIPAVIWVFLTHGAGWGTLLLVWTVVCGVLDNVLRPVLIKRGADLPLLLIFAGVIGGLIAFGVIGLFIGPVVLAVAHALVVAWVSQEPGVDTQRSEIDRETSAGS